VAARDLRECLLLQLNEDRPGQALAIRLLRDHADVLTSSNPEAMARAAGCTEAEVREALNTLRGLQPEPGHTFSTTPTPYISPDVIVRRVNGQYVVELVDEQLPRLRLSNSCRRLLEDRKLGTEDLTYLRRKMRSATFLIQGIGQRQETLRKVAREIVRVQERFFDDPRNELLPLTMASIAARLGVHETTVSRALANKHIETPRGIFEMRHFFRAGYACDDGSAVTPERVKEFLAGMMDRENPVVPLTDLQMARLLRNKGLKVARRTIAKYREEIEYPSSKERVRRRPKKAAGEPANEMPRPVVLPPLKKSEPVSEPVAAYAM
jgi:RNA polymerase sigma-54 factor